MASNVKLYDLSRANHEATKDAIRDALRQAKDREFEGAIVILTKRNDGHSSVIMAGNAVKHERANLELFKLKLKMALDD
ncbi:hypothetical protein [Dechloromonas sp. CZR5]|uniref:hypothetical protein n=1 Tax=Dechloromonas sp. CZR5 TaxID=2608630 RepID=UPI00123E0E58|nr:hypothetical protein [Dechloromonas sp. CZR5]